MNHLHNSIHLYSYSFQKFVFREDSSSHYELGTGPKLQISRFSRVPFQEFLLNLPIRSCSSNFIIKSIHSCDALLLINAFRKEMKFPIWVWPVWVNRFGLVPNPSQMRDFIFFSAQIFYATFFNTPQTYSYYHVACIELTCSTECNIHE